MKGGLRPDGVSKSKLPMKNVEEAIELLFISTLSSTIPTTSDTWLIDSGASRHDKENLPDLIKKESHLRVVLGDDARYSMKGSVSASLQLESSDTLHLNDVIYVLSPYQLWKTRVIKSYALTGRCLHGTRHPAWFEHI